MYDCMSSSCVNKLEIDLKRPPQLMSSGIITIGLPVGKQESCFSRFAPGKGNRARIERQYQARCKRTVVSQSP